MRPRATQELATLIVAGFLAGGCFDPELSGTRCDPAGECPDGYACSPDRYCLPVETPDAGAQDTDSCTGSLGIWVRHFPSSRPSSRRNYAMAYDPARERIVLFGGLTREGVKLLDTWEWDGDTWIFASPKTANPLPDLDSTPRMASDGSEIFLFGGNLVEAWRWNEGWQPVAYPMRPLYYRHGYAIANGDATGTGIILFGGIEGDVPVADIFHVYANQWWHYVPVIGWPSARWAHVMAYDRQSSETLLFGGNDGRSVLTDTWSLRDNNWTEVSPEDCRPTYAGAMAPDGKFGRPLLYDGQLWEWATVDQSSGRRSWRKVVPVRTRPMYIDSFAMAPWREGAILFAGNAFGSGVPETWEFHHVRFPRPAP